jgi:hypothetical protein
MELTFAEDVPLSLTSDVASFVTKFRLFDCRGECGRRKIRFVSEERCWQGLGRWFRHSRAVAPSKQGDVGFSSRVSSGRTL